jgi:acyl-CoA thioester hydrolase
VILQEARVRISRRAGIIGGSSRLYGIVASLTIEYAAEMHYPEAVQVGSGVLEIGRTSFTIGQRARQGGRSSLYAETVMVLTDGSGPMPLSEPMRAAFEALRI